MDRRKEINTSIEKKREKRPMKMYAYKQKHQKRVFSFVERAPVIPIPVLVVLDGTGTYTFRLYELFNKSPTSSLYSLKRLVVVLSTTFYRVIFFAFASENNKAKLVLEKTSNW